jgi:hypothetical protein
MDSRGRQDMLVAEDGFIPRDRTTNLRLTRPSCG